MNPFFALLLTLEFEYSFFTLHLLVFHFLMITQDSAYTELTPYTFSIEP